MNGSSPKYFLTNFERFIMKPVFIIQVTDNGSGEVTYVAHDAQSGGYPYMSSCALHANRFKSKDEYLRYDLPDLIGDRSKESGPYYNPKHLPTLMHSAGGYLQY